MSCSIYIHIPFCLRKCSYCDFNSFEAPGIPTLDYTRLLLGEISTTGTAYAEQPATTLYFGGGTPSLFPTAEIARLIAAVRSSCALADDAEITLEANPGTITRASLAGYRAAGVNRLSLGVQSFDNDKLRLLGRIHTAEEARAALTMARSAGFTNIGIDLMHSLPGQSSSDWQTTLHEALALRPEHISVYGLTAEEGTSLAAMVARGDIHLPEEELAAQMFELSAELLQQAGYDHYEIANFALPGFRSGHNLVYWGRRDYLGFGAGAHSFLRTPGYGVRWENPAQLADYAAVAMQTREIDQSSALTQGEAMAEFFFLGLRLTAGVDLNRFAEEFGVAAETAFPGVIEKLVKNGLLLKDGCMHRLSAQGLLLANRVMVEFV